MWHSKVENKANELSRQYIEEVRDIVLVDHDKLDKHCKTFDDHVSKGEATVEKIFKAISNLKCPKDATIKVLEDYKKEQNGSLKVLETQALEQKEVLNALVNQSKGEDKAREKRNSRLTLWISVAGVLVVFGALFFQIYDMKKTSLKTSAVLEYKMEHMEDKKTGE